MPRRYEQRRRAERRAETRRRIVEATIQLHQTVGPNATTIAEVARRAGVSRLTVYRHFPDQVSLIRACTGEYNIQHPVRDAAGLATTEDPVRRLELALRGVYAYYSGPEPRRGRRLHRHPPRWASSPRRRGRGRRSRGTGARGAGQWHAPAPAGPIYRGARAHVRAAGRFFRLTPIEQAGLGGTSG